MRLAVGFVVLAMLCTRVHADPPGMTPPIVPPPADQPLVESYRLQTGLADTAALLLMTAGVHDGSVASLALGTYVLGAPLVHLAHGRPGRAAGSLALRVGLPVVAAALLASSQRSSCPSTDDTCDDDGEIGAIAVGLLGGMLAASVIDTAFLAKGDDPPAARSWTPTIAPTPHGGLTLGVGLTF